MRAYRPVTPPNSQPEQTPNIQEILRKRREMLNRVKADLARVAKIQQEFFNPKEKEPPRKGI